MIVSWNWLKDFVELDVTPDELAHRFAMSGLNHEDTKPVGDDFAIDLEVTSNRPDCLGHIGVAREAAVLYGRQLKLPAASPAESSTPVADLVGVRIDCPDLCYRYTARVIRGAKIGPSPKWLADRLEAIGIAVINNIVDITNYVLMECGQPLHAFDFAKLNGQEIIVREARDGEAFLAIDHKTYKLEPGMCVIADKTTGVALGGVMGGAETEISSATTDLLIEAAEFNSVSIRGTARTLNLHSDSSYRFERGVDPQGVDWASRRCCELILEIAGGELASGVVDVGREIAPREPIVLRLSQLPRVLGIEIPADEVRRIMTALGCEEVKAGGETIETVPPSWRRDLTREIDLIEEAARIHGYDQIPEDVAVPMAPSHRSDQDRVFAKVRSVLTAAGFDEAMTPSLVAEEWTAAFSPWSDAAPLVSNTPLLRGADRLRKSLIPSLLEARRINQSLANPISELFETAKIYLPSDAGLPREPWMLAIVSSCGFERVKGVVESVVEAMRSRAEVEARDAKQSLLDPAKSCEILLGDKRLGFIGEVSAGGLKQFGLRSPTTIAELDLEVVQSAANLVPQYQELSPYPSISRDINLIVDESLRWSTLAATVRQTGGELLEELNYQETFRDANKDGPNKKRLLFSISLRSAERTLTNEEADALREQIVAACQTQFAAVLVA